MKNQATTEEGREVRIPPREWRAQPVDTLAERMRAVREAMGIREEEGEAGAPTRVFVCRTTDPGWARGGEPVPRGGAS